MGPGGYSRFVDCTFENTRIERWFCFAVELVGCSFSGTLNKAVFNGTARPDDIPVTGSPTNRFEGNDFSRARLVDVAFRTGIDLSKQKLPTGPEYLLIKDAATVVQKARSALNAWNDIEAKRHVRGLLAVLEEDVADGQSELFIRPKDYPRPARVAIQDLLDVAMVDGL